jgi:hypothetical protein
VKLKEMCYFCFRDYGNVLCSVESVSWIFLISDNWNCFSHLLPSLMWILFILPPHVLWVTQLQFQSKQVPSGIHNIPTKCIIASIQNLKNYITHILINQIYVYWCYCKAVHVPFFELSRLWFNFRNFNLFFSLHYIYIAFY